MAAKTDRPKGALNPYGGTYEARARAQAELEAYEWAIWERDFGSKTVTSVTVGGEPVRSAPEEVPESPEGGDEA